MEIRENDKICIFAPLSAKLDKNVCERVFPDLMQESRRVALDLTYAQDCTLDFIENLKNLANKKNLGIINIPSDIFVLFNLMHLDKYMDLFVSELDFKENSRKLINRRFSII